MTLKLIHNARGKAGVAEDIVAAIESTKILGDWLDVLEYEKGSVESLFRPELPQDKLLSKKTASVIPKAFKELLEMDQVLLSPHVAGWTVASAYKLAAVIADKIITNQKIQWKTNSNRRRFSWMKDTVVTKTSCENIIAEPPSSKRAFIKRTPTILIQANKNS